MSEKEKCGDCGERLTKAHEVADGLCWLCGPGSAKWQEKFPDYVHGLTKEQVKMREEEVAIRFCQITGLPLTSSVELELDMHSSVGPGSLKWQERFPKYEHTEKNYRALVRQYEKEKLRRRTEKIMEQEDAAEAAAAKVKIAEAVKVNIPARPDKKES